MTEKTAPSVAEVAPGAHTPTATKETLEDYTLRFAPRHYRRWSTGVVAVSALGGIAYLADFAIGANIGISYGTTNALWGIAVFTVVIFLTGFPLAYYAARYNLDLDLITRGSGFGYYGSVVSNVIFATFTFIFFALEGSIMAQGLLLGLNVPLWAGYAVSTIVIFPLVIYGMKVLSKLQLWTTPLWLILMVIPFAYLLISHPESVTTFFAYGGENGQGATNLGSIMLAAGVCLSLIAQIAEQIDYLRFMPPKTPENSARWWRAMILAGPGWVIFGALKQIIGLFLAVYIIANISDGAGVANQPVHQFLEIYSDIMPVWLALTLAVVLVVISQVKINVTNAYSGSLAWTNSFTRITKHYPGRLVFLAFNLVIALVLMEANMFDFLNTILGFYANCGMAWIVTVASDIVFNKYLLKLSPKQPEFRRGMLFAINPVGFGSMVISAGVSIAPGRDRAGPGPAAGPGACHPGQVLPAADRRRDRPADVRRAREPVRRAAQLPRVPPGLRAPRHGCLPDPRRPGLLALPEHRQGEGPRAARPVTRRPRGVVDTPGDALPALSRGRCGPAGSSGIPSRSG
jgi:purine-cytosine permease-like protein